MISLALPPFLALGMALAAAPGLPAKAPQAQDVAPSPSQVPGSPVRIALHPYVLDLKTIQVTLRGTAYRFLLDTGGGVTTVTPDLARKLGMEPWGRGVGYRMSGEALSLAWGGRLEGRLEGGFPMDLPRVAVFDLASLLPPELPRLDGVISLDAFRGQVLTLDYGRNSLIVQSKASTSAALAAHGLAGRFGTGPAGSELTFVAAVTCPRGALWFLLDSGDADGTMVSEQVAAAKFIGPDPAGAVFNLPGLSPVKLPASVKKIHFDGVFGTDFLMKGPITLDLRLAPGEVGHRP
jgi:hypothetical protein